LLFARLIRFQAPEPGPAGVSAPLPESKSTAPYSRGRRLLSDKFSDLTLCICIPLAVLLSGLFKTLEKAVDKLLFFILHDNNLPLSRVDTNQLISGGNLCLASEMFV
jgi:hypothetical protein